MPGRSAPMSLIPVTAPETIGPSGTLAAASDTLFVPDRGFLVGYHAAPAAGAPSDAFSSYWQSGQPAQLLHSVTDGNQSDVALALLTNGTIAVAWQDDGPIVGGPQGQDGIVLALFGEDGVTVPIKEVSQAAGSGGDLDPALAALADGGLAVGWSTVVDGPRPGSGEAVHLGPQVRIVEADGEPRTGLLERDPDPAVDVTVRGLAALADGGFLGVAQLATAESGDQ